MCAPLNRRWACRRRPRSGAILQLLRNIGSRTQMWSSFVRVWPPQKMAAPFIRHFVFKICETKAATPRRRRETQPWPGICYFGADAARVVWMDGKDTYYDGKEAGPLYSRASLDADLAAAELVIAAIHSPEVVASDDTVRVDLHELNDALKHVHAAMHLDTETPQDWLSWFVSRLAEAPALPQLNSRGKPKLKCRGVAKSKLKCACSRQQFATNLTGLKGPEVTLLWRAHKTTHH